MLLEFHSLKSALATKAMNRKQKERFDYALMMIEGLRINYQQIHAGNPPSRELWDDLAEICQFEASDAEPYGES